MEWIALAVVLAVVFIYISKRYGIGLWQRKESAEQKGYRGEFYVRRVVGDTVPGEKYVINDLIFRHGERTCQIDHIVINKNGVYVIETKNYSGAVCGNDRKTTWVQHLGGKANRFYSPVKQNAAHIGYLQQRLDKKLYMINLVVFVQDNTENIRSDAVIPLSVLKRRLELPSKIKPYSAEEMHSIYEKILALREDSVTAEEHTAAVTQTKETVKSGICPRCGRTLVTRRGRYGFFLGCSGYPECNFIKKGN